MQEASQNSISLFSGSPQTRLSKSAGGWSWDKPWLISSSILCVALAKSSLVGRSLLLTVMAANITLTIKISLCLFRSPTQADVKSIPSGSKSLIGFTCLINLKDGQSITKMQHRDSVRYKHVGYTEDTGIFIEKGRCFYSANKHYAST